MNNFSDNCEYEYSNGEKCEQPVSKDYKDSKGRRFCIFHSHNDEKHNDFSKLIQNEINNKSLVVSRFRDSINNSSRSQDQRHELLKNRKEKELIRFEGYYFPDGFQFNRTREDNNAVIVLPNITFKNAIFKDIADISNFHFEGDVDLSKASFLKKADFSHSAYYGVAIIFKSIFNGEVNFNEAVFQDGKPDFSEIQFPDQASFFKTRFDKGANFSQTKFKGYANFQSAQFGKEKKGETEFWRAPDFWTVLNVSLFLLNIQHPKVQRAGRTEPLGA